MTNGIGTVEIRRSRGKLVLRGLGQTPRGQKYIKRSVDLGVKNTADPAFKSKLAAAVTEMFAELPSPP